MDDIEILAFYREGKRMQIQTNRNQREIKAHGDFTFPVLVSKECITDYEFGTFSWHWHSEIEMTLVEDGEMIYQVNGADFHLQEGDVMFGNVLTALDTAEALVTSLENTDIQKLELIDIATI